MSAPERDDFERSELDWDQLSIETPELVAIAMPVAGIGSRFVALLVDYLIWMAAFVGLIFFMALVDPSLSHFSKLGEKWEMALVTLGIFFFYWGYFTLFEAFWGGRTPGKRVAGIRVIQVSGRGIGLFESMTRNLLRVVDQFPGIYVVGVVSVFATRRHQRLGDLAAGTMVVHERKETGDAGLPTAGRTFTSGLFEEFVTPTKVVAQTSLPAGAVQRLGTADLEVLESFFARRLDFTLETRAALAGRMAAGILAKAGLEVPVEMSVETFLEEVARQLRDVLRLR